MYLRAFGQAPTVYRVTLANQEAMRAATEAAYFALSPADRPNWQSILDIPDVVKAGAWFQDPTTGAYYRGNGPFNVAYETMPPTIGGAPGTWQTGVQISDAEAAAWIARVEASRQAWYGSPLTLPSRLGWTTPLSIDEINAWSGALGWPIEKVQQFFDSFPTREAAQAWLVQAQANPALWQQKADQLWPAPPPVVLPIPTPTPTPTPAPPPIVEHAPPPAAPPGNVAPVGTTPEGHRYPILPYAPNAGTPMLQQSGWQPDEIGFWLANAFGGDMALTEAFLLSFSGREALAAWLPGKTPADTYARADAALAARRRQAPTTTTIPPVVEYAPPGEGGISFPLLALLGAGAIFLMKR